MIPIEIRTALPSDPERIMEVAYEIMRHGYNQKVEALEAEIAKAKGELSSKIKVSTTR